MSVAPTPDRQRDSVRHDTDPHDNDRYDERRDNQNSSTQRNFWLQFARYSQLAFVLPAATVVGWLGGAALDRWLHTTWIYLAGIFLGIAAGFVELIRTALRDSK